MKKIYSLLSKQSLSIGWLLIFSALGGFNQSSAQGGIWTWISGPSFPGSPPVYGTQGVPNINNNPADLWEPCEWKDNNGNFWIYGGIHNGSDGYGDLWKYNPVTNEWTWVKGTGVNNPPAVYGTKGVPAPANTPGKRTSTTITWVDAAGNLWLFGGQVSSSSVTNDLWKYDISTNNWTWISGNNAGNSPGVYGTQGAASPLNVPGARNETCSGWTDAQNNLWLFGGAGYDGAGTGGLLNDLWKYNIAANEWTWMKGSAFVNAVPDYGTIGVSNPTNNPGARTTWTKWKDLQGNFWLMGGHGPTNDSQSDVWKYDIVANEWTWMNGADTISDAGSYQAICVDTLNNPKARGDHRASVTDNSGNFWLFGGYFLRHPPPASGGWLNDLWIFNPQQLKWKWLNGTNAFNQPNNYGTKGVPSPSNVPASRKGAVVWWGNDNKFYMFGGSSDGFLASNFSDLWVFNPDTNCVTVTSVTTPLADVKAFVNVAPNPNSGLFTVELQTQAQVSIYNTLGKIIYSAQHPKGKHDINISESPAGVCFLKVQDKNNYVDFIKLVTQ